MRLIDAGATCIFEETGELVGCEFHMESRAARPELGREIVACVDKAARYYSILGHGSFAVGNADGGLTTQEEKSLGAYAKSGASPIVGHRQTGRYPADRRLVSARCRARRRTALRLSEHQRQRGNRRADRVRRARDPVHDRARFGGRFGHFARHQDVRESGDVSQSFRRYGRRRRPHSRRPRARSTKWAAKYSMPR